MASQGEVLVGNGLEVGLALHQQVQHLLQAWRYGVEKMRQERSGASQGDTLE